MNTIEEMAQDAITKIHPNDAVWVKECPTHELHHTLGRWIRNTYKLWDSHPLTQNYFSYPECRDIREGIDYSEDHPDAVSNKIIKRIQELL